MFDRIKRRWITDGANDAARSERPGYGSRVHRWSQVWHEDRRTRLQLVCPIETSSGDVQIQLRHLLVVYFEADRRRRAAANRRQLTVSVVRRAPAGGRHARRLTPAAMISEHRQQCHRSQTGQRVSLRFNSFLHRVVRTTWSAVRTGGVLSRLFGRRKRSILADDDTDVGRRRRHRVPRLIRRVPTTGIDRWMVFGITRHGTRPARISANTLKVESSPVEELIIRRVVRTCHRVRLSQRYILFVRIFAHHKMAACATLKQCRPVSVWITCDKFGRFVRFQLIICVSDLSVLWYGGLQYSSSRLTALNLLDSLSSVESILFRVAW